MTLTQLHAGETSPRIFIDALIARYGTWRVIRALIAGLMAANRSRRPGIEGLNDHLRRDVGLPPDHPPPRIRDIRL